LYGGDIFKLLEKNSENTPVLAHNCTGGFEEILSALEDNILDDLLEIVFKNVKIGRMYKSSL
jgi:hypothetical protein